MNTTRMHARTHVRPEHRSQPGLTALTEYADGMIETDAVVGTILDKLDELGIADNTIVIYTTDNGPHQNTWPDAGTTPFRSEKNTNWEGAFRVPAVIRWPGHIEPGTELNGIFSGLDWFPTLLAAAGDTDIKERLLDGHDDRRQGVQEPPRRLQPAPVPDRRDRRERPQGVLLLQRRRPARGVALRELEARLRRAAGDGHPGGSGPSPSRSCGCRRCSTCAPTPTSAPTSPRTPTTTGCSTTPTWWSRRRPGWRDFLQTFTEFPPAQRPASFSIDQIQERARAAAQQHRRRAVAAARRAAD